MGRQVEGLKFPYPAPTDALSLAIINSLQSLAPNVRIEGTQLCWSPVEELLANFLVECQPQGLYAP